MNQVKDTTITDSGYHGYGEMKLTASGVIARLVAFPVPKDKKKKVEEGKGAEAAGPPEAEPAEPGKKEAEAAGAGGDGEAARSSEPGGKKEDK